MSGSFGPLPSGSGGSGSTNLASPVSIGNVTPNTINATDLTNNGRLIAIPGAVQNLVATSIITCTTNNVLVSSVAPITLSSNPQIAVGSNGQKLNVYNIGFFPITFVIGNGIAMLNPTYVLAPNQAAKFTYLNSVFGWLLESAVGNSIALTGIPTTTTPAFNTQTDQIANTRWVYNHLYDHNFPGWRTLPLTASWVNFGNSFPDLSIKRIGRDQVYVRGVVTLNGSFDTVITTIPADCRPSSTHNFLGAHNNGVGQLSVLSNGNITCATNISTGQYHVVTFNYSL